MRKRLSSFLLVLTMIVGILPTIPPFDVFAADDGLVPGYESSDGTGTTATNSSVNGYDGTLYGAASSTSGDAILLSESLLAKYPLLEDVKDVSGNGKDGTAVGGITYGEGLTLPGGTNSNTNYVSLPGEIFVGQDSLTISVWLKSNTSAGNYAALFFGTGAVNNLPTNYWLFNPTNPSGNFKSVFTDSADASAPWSTEVGVSTPSTTDNKGVWTHYTTVITPTAITGYVNGVLGGTTPKTRTTTDFGDTLFAYIGRSNYLKDWTFAGSYQDLRIYGAGFDASQIETLFTDSQDDFKLNQAKNALVLSNTTNVINDIELPTTGINGATISWSSNNPDAVSDTGKVILSADVQTAVLTATISLNEKVLIKEFTVTTAKQDGIMDILVNRVTVPYILTEEDKLPTSIDSATITWSSDNGMVDENGNVTGAPSQGMIAVSLTATITLDSQIKEKVFNSKIIESSPNYILSYIRSGDNSLSNSMHLGYSEDGQEFSPLNNNTGVLFAKADFTIDPIKGTTKLLIKPYIFRMKDGSFGVVATRTNAGGAGDSTAKSSVLFFTSDNLTHFEEVGLISLNTTDTVNNPICEYDSALDTYRINWVNQDGKAYYNTTDDFITVSNPEVSEEVEKPTISTSIAGAVPGNIVPITKEEGTAITNKLLQVVNTEISKVELKTSEGTPLTFDKLGKVTLTYSDGTTAEKSVNWNQSDFDSINFNEEGIYTVSGTIKQTTYPFPMIAKRADPDVIKYNGKYYFIATDENGQDELFIKVADTIEGLAAAKDNLIFTKTSSGDMSGCIWAPELHVVNGELYIFFAASTTGSWNAVQCRVMQLKNGQDPILAASWNAPIRCLKNDGSNLYSDGITLDMTTFEQGGRQYVIWAQRYIGSPNGSSDLYIGEVTPQEPWKLISDPVLISRADYGWDRNTSEVDEGPYALKHEDNIFVTFSGSNVDDTYCLGLLTAKQGADLLQASSWEKANYPILTAQSIPNQYGPGHNTFTVDEDGNDVMIFHAKATAGGSRDMGARRVFWGASGTPNLTMTDEREIANKNIKARVIVIGTSTEDELLLKSSLNNIKIPNADNVKGNITLPTTEEQYNATLTWASSDESVISTAVKQNEGYDSTPAGTVNRQSEDTKVTLTVTATLNSKSMSKDIEVTVKKAAVKDEYAGYIYTYFRANLYGTGESQQIHLASSKDGLFWDDMNSNEPILVTDVGTKGVRDSYVVRAPEGDKFYLIATDLDANGGNWAAYAGNGSKSIVVWESDDLVNWSDERLIPIAPEDAGNMWAPETIYDPVTGEYVVYWASYMSGQHSIYYAKTRDFWTFTEPKVYKAKDGSITYIDTSMIEHNGTYYRFTKKENDLTVLLEKSNAVLGDFTLVKNKIADQDGVEGPAIFKFIGEEKWCLLLDGYAGSNSGVGFFPLVAESPEDLDAGNFRRLTDTEFRMPTGAKHGCIMPVTQKEYDAIMEKWGKDLVRPVTPDPSNVVEPDLEYNFDETLSGNTVLNTGTSGAQNNGILYNNATYKQDAEKGQVLYLAGGNAGTNSQYLEFPQGYFDGKDNVTISMDIKSEMDNQFFFTFGIGQNTQKYLFLRTRANQIYTALTVKSNSKEQKVIATPSSSMKNVWTNITIVLERNADGNHSTMKVYKDKLLVGENTELVANLSTMGANLLAYLGKAFYSDPYFKGSFDNVKVYNRALSEEEVTGIAKGSIEELSQLVTLNAGKKAEDYTVESFATFEAAYNQAQEILAKEDPTTTEVKEAIDNLKDAISKLEVVVKEEIILHYTFDDELSSGIVRDISGKNNNGTMRGTGASFENGVLSLPGGAAGGSAAYVELPTGMFDKRDTLTITTWLKNETGKGNYAAMFFGTTESLPSQYWLFNPANPSGRFKSVITNSLNTAAPYGTEYGISPSNSSNGISGPTTDSNWAFYTTVIEPTQISAYYNGVKVGTVATNRTVSQFGEDLVAYIGKSSYIDPYFKGYIKDVKVYTAAHTEEQIKTEMTKALLDEAIVTLELEDTTVISDILLPAKFNNCSITWKSSNASFITDDGQVTRPAEGQGDANVTLTATLLLNGITETKQFNIVVLEDTSEKDLAYLTEIAEAFELGANYVADDIALPTSTKDNVAISWKTANASVISATGQVTRPQIGAGNEKVNLTAVLQLGQAKIEKVFEVTVLEETYGYLLSYVVSGDTAKTDALHIAYSIDGNTYTALYNNRPIQYASQGSDKMGSPSLFRKIDGTYGLIAADNNSSKSIILFDSEDLLTFTNERLIQIGGSVNVKHPICSFDASVGAYRINFEGSDGKSYTTVTKDFVSFTAIEETSYEKAAVGSETLPTGAIETSVFELTKAEYERVINKYSRITNTGVKPAQVVIKTGNTLTTPNRVTLTYSDGSTKDMGVVWNQEQLEAVDTSKKGTYTVTGTVVQPQYANPLVEERADPWVILGDDGWYYFTGSYPVRGDSDPEGYDRIILRRSKTIEGLTDAEEITIWDEKDSDTANRYIWAPEIHSIDGKWYVLFTASRSGNVWDIRPHMLACEGDGDPFKPENWVEKGQVKAASGDTFAFSQFSLDMTYFESNGKHYVAWAQSSGSSNIYLATINPEEPWQLTSAAMLLTTPQYGWEWNGGTIVNEGAAALKHDGKVFVFFSGSTVDRNYCVGYVSADMDADLMDISSWTKNAYPLLTSDDLNGEFGPGHNSFTVDGNGNPVIVYHARPEDCALGQCEFGSSTDLNDPCRHARAKNVHFAVDGSPILNMTYEEELAEEFKTVTMTVKVEKRSSGGGSSDKDNTTGSSTKPTTTVSGSIVNTNITSKVDNGKATGTLTQSQMNDILAKAQNAANKTGDKAKIEINLDKSEGASTVEANIPGASIQAMTIGNIAYLTISNELASITFDSASLNTISDEALDNVAISVAKADSSTLSDKAKNIVGDRPVYDFTVRSGENSISQFGGSVTIAIPYTPAVGEDINAIIIYFINDNGELEVIASGRYDDETGTVVFTTDHFSTYAIGYNKIIYSDVFELAWYDKAVTFIAARGITAGTGNNKFSPEINLTRGQFITLLLKAYEIKVDQHPVNNFADAGNTYYTGYLAAAKRLGITKGVGNNKFAPNNEITRQEMFTMLYKTLKVIGKLPEETEDYLGNTLDDFTDSDNIAPYAVEAMNYLVKTGIVNGSNEKLIPEGTTTRAQMAQVLYNLMMK